MALVNDSSILMSIKRLLNIEPEEMGFDTQIGMHINEEFMTLHQLGIGPDEGFSINDADTKWTDFSTDKTLVDAVKTYIYYRVRLVFDPPASSIVADSINARISELQFRLNCQAERDWKSEEESEEHGHEHEHEHHGHGGSDDHGKDHDKDDSCKCKNKKIYDIEGENITLFTNRDAIIIPDESCEEEAGEP